MYEFYLYNLEAFPGNGLFDAVSLKEDLFRALMDQVTYVKTVNAIKS